MPDGAAPRRVLVVRSGGRRCAIELGAVLEVLRPLPCAPVAGAPPYVAGAAVVRGEAVPVVDLDALLTGGPARGGARWVRVRAASGAAVLAVDEVAGVAELDAGALAARPLLGAGPGSAAERLGAEGGELLVALAHAALVPDELRALAAAAAGDGPGAAR